MLRGAIHVSVHSALEPLRDRLRPTGRAGRKIGEKPFTDAGIIFYLPHHGDTKTLCVNQKTKAVSPAATGSLDVRGSDKVDSGQKAIAGQNRGGTVDQKLLRNEKP